LSRFVGGFRLVRVALVAVAMLTCAAAMAQDARPAETKEQRDQRMAWWREAKYGMFIHWGLYAIPAGEWRGNPVGGAGEWIMFSGHIPVADYEPLAKQFNPVRFNAAEWVSLAKRAGMKYVVITSKHHDGFCLWDSKLTDYDVVDATPFGRDIIKELSDEVHRQGLRMCFYHSILDWHHPDYLPRGEGSPRPWDTRPTDGADLDRYIKYMKGQLRELVTRYGDIGVLWFDGGWEHSPEEIHSQEVVDLLRGLQPEIIINNRINLPQDFDTPEQSIPATGIPDRDWETCMTMNGTWGFSRLDPNWKSVPDLLHMLVDIASKGGNYLLNVGPTELGEIPEASVERLTAIGDWLKVNGDSLYGTTASVFPRLPWGRCTRKGQTLFLHVFDWPQSGKLEVPGLQNDVTGAKLLATGKAVTAARSEAGWVLDVPTEAPDPIDTVIALTIAGEPKVEYSLRQSADGTVELRAMDATVHGESARYESGGDRDNIGYWVNATDWVSWDVLVDQPGTFRVKVTYACDPGTPGAEFGVEAGGASVRGKVRATESWTQFIDEDLEGTLRLDKGKTSVAVRPTSMPGYAVMNLKAIRLEPVR